MTALLPCPLCGAQEGYSLIDGGDYKRWSVQCMGCGEVLSECRRTYPDGEEETRSDQGDAAWNDAGAYAQSLRDATALAVAAERERCAAICDAQFWRITKWRGGDAAVAAGECAAEIRKAGGA